MTIKKRLVVVAGVLAALWCGSVWAELVVATNGTLNVTEATTITGPTNIYYNGTSGHTISADLTLKGQTFIRLMGDIAGKKTTYLDIGPTSGSGKVTISTDAKSGLYGTYRNATIEDSRQSSVMSYIRARIGEQGGSATFDISGYVQPVGYTGFQTPQFGAWFERVEISANATTDGDYFDIVTVNAGGRFNTVGLYNNGPKPARILFNGGQVDLWYINGGNNDCIFRAAKGKPLYLTSLNGNPINFYKTAKTVEYMTYGDGTIYVQGPKLRLGSNGNWSGGHLDWKYKKKHQAASTSQVYDCATIDWSGLTGDIELYGKSGLALYGSDMMPWGKGTGILRIINDDAPSASSGAYDSSRLEVDGATTNRLNGIVAQGKRPQYACVTNLSSSSISTIILGDGDADGILSVRVSKNLDIRKVGAGTLDISNATFLAGSKLTLCEGTTVLKGTNALPTGDDFAIEDGAVVIREEVVDVPSGTTTTQTEVYTNDASGILVRLRKTGAGTLVLNNAGNTFSGGLVIDQGIVKVTAEGAQGLGKITVNSTSTKVCQIKFATVPGSSESSVTYTNDIEVTGKSASSVTYAAISIAQTNQVLTGSITAADDLYLADDATPCGSYDSQERDCLTCWGDITVPADRTFYITSGWRQHYHGKISAGTVYLPSSGGYRGKVYLYAANAIGTLRPYANTTPKVFVMSSRALEGTAIDWPSTDPNGQASIRGVVDPGAASNMAFSVKSLNGVDCLRSSDSLGYSGYTMGCNSPTSYSYPMTITGEADTTVRFCGGFGAINLGIELAAPATFTQIFSNVYDCAKGELKVSGGTLVIAGKSYFPNLTTITVEGGVLDIRGLGSVADETANALPALKTINVNSGAQVKLAEGIWLSAATVKVDGFQLNAETYTSGSKPRLNWLSGDGTITATSSPTLPVEAKDATWSGNGEDTSTETAANWETTPTPAFYYHGYRPVFGTGGSEALFPTGVNYLNGIKFTRDGNFTVKGAAGATLQLDAAINVRDGVNDDYEYAYEITAPIKVATASQIWTVPSNKTLKVSGGISVADGFSAVAITNRGDGVHWFKDARYNGYLNANTAGCGTLKLTGDIGVPGDAGKLVYRNYSHARDPQTGKYGSTIYGFLHLDGATVYKPFDFQSAGQVTCTNGNNQATWLTTTEGSTNIFKEAVTHAGSTIMQLDSNATIVFEKGYGDPSAKGGGGFNPAMKSGCTNGTMVFKGPLRLINVSKGFMSVSGSQGLKLVYDCTGNCCTNYFNMNYYTSVFKVDDAFMGTKYFLLNGGSNNSVVDLTTTRQSIPMFWVKNGCGVIRGEHGEVAITAGPANESAAATTNFCPSAINGWVKLSMSGNGYQKIGNATSAVNYDSCGDLEVSNGTLELQAATTWVKGTNFIVRGEGTLKLSATTAVQVGSQAVFRFADNGKVNIPANVTYNVDAIYVGDSALPSGTYDKNSTGLMQGRITGEGAIKVRAGMFMIVF